MHVSPWTFISGLVYVGNVRAQCVIVYKKMLIKLGVNAKRYVAYSTQSGVFFLFFFYSLLFHDTNQSHSGCCHEFEKRKKAKCKKCKC